MSTSAEPRHDRAPTTTIVEAEVAGERLDVRLEDGRIEAVDRDLDRAGTRVVDAKGGALIPGLHDHHLHLLAMAAHAQSIDANDAATAAAFDRRLREAARRAEMDDDAWLRVVGYDERHGPLDATRLDALAPDRRVRVQHRTGGAWMVNSAGIASIAARPSDDGWFHRRDEELRALWNDDRRLDLAAVSRLLASHGVTGVTDATPFADLDGYRTLASARTAGEIRQRVVVTGSPALATQPAPHDLELGPVKVVVHDHDLPDPDDLAKWFATAHRAGRPVAVHCVTRVALVLALAAWDAVGVRAGDRIEHGSVIPIEFIARIAAHNIGVVTQPGFLGVRGDSYLTDVEADDRPHLYRCGSLIDAGIGVGMSTDAPYGPADPWFAIARAADRRAPSGATVGDDRPITPRQALNGFLSHLSDPGGSARSIASSQPADVVLLDAPLATTFDRLMAEGPTPDLVRATWIEGTVAHTR